MNNFFVIGNNEASCVDLGQNLLVVCITKEDCNPTDTTGLYAEVGDQWNCNLCQSDKAFWLPVYAGDTMQFQLQFVDNTNADPENPSLGWGDWVHLEVLDLDGNIVGTEATANLVIRNIVAHSGKLSYQSIEIDFDEIPSSCFSIRFYTDDSPAQEVITQHFAKTWYSPCPVSLW